MANSKKEISSKDEKILDVMMDDARQSSVEISEKVGMSRQTVQKTISRLEENHVIWGYIPVVDLRRIGKKLFITLIKTTPNITKENILEILPVASKGMEEQGGIHLIYTGFTHGYFDWIVIFAASDIVQASKTMRSMQGKLSDFIEDIQILEELMPVRFCGVLNPDYKVDLDNIL